MLSVCASPPKDSGPSVMEILDNEMYVADRHLGNAVEKLKAKITPKEAEETSPQKPRGAPGRSYLRGTRNVSEAKTGSGAKSPRRVGGATSPSTKHSYSSGRRTSKQKEMGNEKGPSPRASGGRVKTSVNTSDLASRRSDPTYRFR